MKKRVIKTLAITFLILLIVAILIFLFVTPYGLALLEGHDMRLYRKVDYKSEKNGNTFKRSVEYNDVNYYYDEAGFFDIQKEDDDILLGWAGISYFFYRDMFYFDTSENPIYISFPRLNEVFLREDYDFRTDIFILEGTDSKIVFSDMLTDIEFDYDLFVSYKGTTYITMYSETYPRLKIWFKVFFNGEEWCVSTRSFKSYAISYEFLDFLIENRVITE